MKVFKTATCQLRNRSDNNFCVLQEVNLCYVRSGNADWKSAMWTI